jgi:hypothetical protein
LADTNDHVHSRWFQTFGRVVSGILHRRRDAVTVFPQEFDLVTDKVPDYTTSEMKAKMFEVVLHLLPSGKSPVTALEEQINEFLVKHPDLKLVTTHMSTLVAPAEPNALPKREEASIIVFCTLFYND